MAKKSESQKQSEQKTNVMRLLEQEGLAFTAYYYETSEAISGVNVARVLGQNPAKVFKTLVTVGKTGTHYVFVIPVAEELDLKKAAKAVGDKSIAMVKSKELLPLTGYVHGGCSPIGMKKPFQTVLHETAKSCDVIMFSAGKIGYQVAMRPDDLQKIVPFTYVDVIC